MNREISRYDIVVVSVTKRAILTNCGEKQLSLSLRWGNWAEIVYH
jgi:hypothetical protein